MRTPRPLRNLAALALALAGLGVPVPSASRAQSTPAESLSDAEFWEFLSKRSEPDGYFLSENFVSNEMGFQEVIPALQRSLTPGAAYLGVGPEQNFTYIANLRPRLAIIFDIRRQNAMLHLMYKALFELSPTRAEFVSRLFSRPAVAALPAGLDVTMLFDSARSARRDSAAYLANRRAIFRQLTAQHGFPLSTEDSLSIEHVFGVFYAAGPDINYGYRPGVPGAMRATYPTFAMLQSAVNADSVRMAFLATEGHYAVVRDLQRRNLIVPVVADFGGPAGIRAVGDYLRQRRLTVGAFYVSNVEQYLFRPSGGWDRFYANVSALPLDSTSTFIRSIPRSGGGTVMFNAGPAGGTVLQPGVSLMIVRDSAGIRTITTSMDSAGRTVRDTAGTVRPPSADTSIAAILRARRDSIQRANASWSVAAGPPSAVVMGSLLTSGLASINATLQAYFTNQLTGYGSVIGMTRTGPWR